MTSERTQVALGVLLIAHVRGADRNGPGCALPRRRRPATCGGSEAQAEMHVVRRRTEELPIKRGCFASALAREHDGGGRHVRSDRVQPEIECRRDPEVRTGATKTPEQVRVFFIADVAHRAVRGHEFYREQVVDREAVLWLEAAHAASEREPRDPGVTDDADRTRESVLVRSAVELLEQRASLHSRDPLSWIDLDGPHAREIDDNAAVARREAGDALAPAANRNDEIVLAGEADRRDDVHDTSAPRDERGMAVGHRVPDDAAGVVLAIAGLDQLAAKAIPELFKRGRIETLGNGSSSPS